MYTYNILAFYLQLSVRREQIKIKDRNTWKKEKQGGGQK
jgi:hypothetical protein